MAVSPLGAGCAVRLDEALRQAADLCRRRGGTMSIKRTIIIPAILTLSTAGSIVAASSATVVATSAPTAAMAPAYLYHG